MAFPSPTEILKTIQGGSSTAPFLSASTPLPSPQQILSQTQQQNPKPSFGSSLLTTAKSFISKAVPAIGNFLGQQAKNVSDAVTGKLSATPQDYLEGIKKVGTGIDTLAKGFNEGVARIIKSTSVAVAGPETTEKIANFGGPVSIAKFSKDVTGKDEITSYQQIYDKAHSYAIDNNATIPQAGTFAGLTVLGTLFVDNPLIGPGKGSVFKLSEDAVAQLTKETAEDAIKAIIKTENPALTDVELDALAPIFRDAKTPEEIKAATQKIAEIQQAPIGKNADAGAPHPDDVMAAAKENLNTPGAEAPKPSYFRAIEDADKNTNFAPVEGEPVKLLDGLDTFVHQPENGAYEVLESSTGRMIGKAAETREAAIQSAEEALAGKSLEDVKAAIDGHLARSPVGPREAGRLTPGSPQAAAAAERGMLPGTAPRPFDTGLIRELSQETTPGPILDRIRELFPTLSDQALAPIAARLAHLKRTGDIEGILQVVRNISEDIAKSRGKRGISKEALGRSVAKVGTRDAVGDLPPSIGELMTPAERGKYLDNISRVVRSPEDAVLAQQEYDALFEHADQRILDRYEELKIHRTLLRDAIETSPGRELNNLYKGTFTSPRDLTLEQLQSKKPKNKIDSRVEDAMSGQQDLEAAQTQLEDFLGMKDQLKAIEADLREIRPKARAARVLQSMVEDVPVISRAHAGEIESLAGFDDVRKYTDISGFMGQARDVYRNFEKVFGDRFSEVKRIILDPFDKSKGDMIDLLKKIGDDLDENVMQKYGFKRGSKESAAIQRYGDSSLAEVDRLTFDQLVEQFGRDKAAQIIEANTYFRKQYDNFIDTVNRVREDIFPNDPKKLIPKRKDYYRHFTELGDGFKQVMDIFENQAGIDPKLAGLSEWTKPKSKFLSFAQERIGKNSTIDAIGGFLDYAPSYAYAVHIDPHIGNFRYLRRRISEVAPTSNVRELVPAEGVAGEMGAKNLVKQKGLDNFLTFLDDYANDLAGKTNPMDRYIQKVVPGGRKTMRVIDFINSRVKANTILGNLSSAIAQIFNVPNGIASAGIYSVPGMKRTLASIVTHDDSMAASNFLKERYKDDLTTRFKIDWLEHPIRGTTERGRDMAAWITGALDEVGTKFIWQSHYAKALAEHMENPIKYADDKAREMVAGRGVGEVPLLQKSKMFQVVAPFQLEVGNAWYVLGKFIKQKDFGAIATLLVANYLFNRAAEEIRGTPVVYDPIQALIDGVTDASDEMSDNGNAGRAAYKFLGRQVGETLSNVPLGQTIAGALPDDFVKDKLGFEGGKAELFGSGDPGRFGSGLLAINGLTDPLYKLILPFGGAQVKRTFDGVMSMIQGQVKDKNDKLSFNTNRTLGNIVQAVLFGKNATQDAQKFYDERDDLFQRVYRQEHNRSEAAIEAEKTWADIQKLPKAEQVEKLKALDEKDPDLSDAVFQVAKDEAAGLSGTDRLIKMLGVENGERAKYIADSIGNFETRQEQVLWLKDLDDKKLISDTVFQQLELLLPGKIKKQ